MPRVPLLNGDADNFMYVRNQARAYHRKKTPALLFKLDISKAFDMVSWEYMLELLERQGFSDRWREWLAIIFKSSHSTVLLNGTEGSRINHVSGLRQGDPLSPYLFILAIDTLHSILELATTNGILSPLRGRHASYGCHCTLMTPSFSLTRSTKK